MPRHVGNCGRQPSRATQPRHSDGLVIDHTGRSSAESSVFVFPSTTKAQRDSLLTRLADEKAYRRLAISKDTKWADIALAKMPVQQARPAQDVSKAIALFEQLERVGVGMDPGSAARANAYLRRRARLSRNADPTEADFAEAAQYAAIAEPRCASGRLRGRQGWRRFRKGRQGWRRLRTRVAPTSPKVAPTSVPVSESLTATRSAPHGARLQVAPHHRCAQLTRAVGSSFAGSRFTPSGFSWSRASLVEVQGLPAVSNEKREPSTIA